MGAELFACLEQLQDKLSVVPAIMAMQAGQSSEFEGVIDLVKMKFILKDPTDKTHVKNDLVEIPAKYKEQAEEYHHKLLDVGLSPRQAVLLIYAITLGLGALAFVSSGRAQTYSFVGLLAVFGISLLALPPRSATAADLHPHPSPDNAD